MKCFIGIGWVVSGEEKELSEYEKFSDEFFPFLISQNNEMDVEDFCDILIKEIDKIIERHELKTKLIKDFSLRLKNTLNNNINRNNACQYAKKYIEWLKKWTETDFGNVANLSVKKFEEWGIQPLCDSLGAVASFGNAIFGKYVPSLRAVCVQLDVVSEPERKYPELQFIETLLHEEVHAVIHANMGEDEKRRELTWLEELAAVLTSQHAIECAIKQLGNINEMEEFLKDSRKNQKYGELANAVLKDTDNPLIPWRAWQKIFNLSPEDKHNYAKESVIKPILHNLGWKVEFPYEYGNKYVTVYI